ncbi:MAG: magnesium/cobalt efflux protein [Woeseia sp.]|nr:magnesium/cobalt efflux protein [Woeseia sp.]|tara:strand:- start:1513 stop:2391 length:879 start_codon:yes stop_codon:yes gene_type:complete
MNDKPPSTTGSGKVNLLRRVIRAIKDEPLSRDQIQDLLQEDKGVFAPEEKDMLSGVLEVAETQVREVMVPRSQMIVIEKDQPIDEMLDVIISSGHSRFPVIGQDRDEIIGILLAKDLLKLFGERKDTELQFDKFLRPAAVIPESKRLDTLLKEFRASHNHMAIVVDEYGGVSGLLTIEDVLEEIVGEIDDEHDQEDEEDIKLDTDAAGHPCHTVRALTRIEDFNEYFGSELTEEHDYDTIGGLVMHELGRLPRPGELLDYGGFQFRVTRAESRRIDAVQVTPSSTEAVVASD